VAERRFKRAAVGLVLQRIAHDLHYIQKDDYGGDLVLLGPLLDGRRDDVLLAVAAHQDLLAESRIPVPRDDRAHQRGGQVIGNGHGPRLPQMGERVRCVPERLGDSAAGLLGDHLAHPGHDKHVLAEGLCIPVVLGRTERNQQDVIDLQPFLDVLFRHRLVVDLRGLFHVSTARRKLPISHVSTPFQGLKNVIYSSLKPRKSKIFPSWLNSTLETPDAS